MLRGRVFLRFVNLNSVQVRAASRSHNVRIVVSRIGSAGSIALRIRYSFRIPVFHPCEVKDVMSGSVSRPLVTTFSTSRFRLPKPAAQLSTGQG